MTQEFERKLITRIIIMKLNETREWPNDLIIKELEANNVVLN